MRDAIAELGYVVNSAARSLATGRRQCVALLAQDLTNLREYEESIDDLGEGSTIALTLPSLRSLLNLLLPKQPKLA